MSDFSTYSTACGSMKMARHAGVLQITLHTDDGPFQWGHGAGHGEFAQAFADIARDPENKIVIITGTGDLFSGPRSSPDSFPTTTARQWDALSRNGMILMNSILDIDAIVISCVNGPALRHIEIPLLADIVLAAPEATFEDTAHFGNRTTPGDGVNFILPLLMGLNRARYFLLTGQALSASQAFDLGLVNEIHPRERLLPRAWELAHDLRRQNPMVIRYTRMLLTHQLKKMTLDLLGYGLALEGLAVVDEGSTPRG